MAALSVLSAAARPGESVSDYVINLRQKTPLDLIIHDFQNLAPTLAHRFRPTERIKRIG